MVRIATALRLGTMLALLAGGIAAAEERHHRQRQWVPEFDAATAGAIAALVAGGALIFARRRGR